MENNDWLNRTDYDDEKDKVMSEKPQSLELECNPDTVNEKLRKYLAKLPKAEMIARINGLQLSDKSLNFLSEGIALQHEDYEICAAVEEIKKQRAAAKQAAQMPG